MNMWWTCDDTFYQETCPLGTRRIVGFHEWDDPTKRGWLRISTACNLPKYTRLGLFLSGNHAKINLYILFPYYLRSKRMENPSFLDDIHWFFRSNFHFEWISHCHVVRLSGNPIANFWWSWLNLGDICYLCVSSHFFNVPMGNPLHRDSSTIRKIRNMCYFLASVLQI